MELQTCLEQYLSKFGDDSWFPSDFKDEEENIRLFNEITDFIDDCFIYLTRSILSGEYIEYSEFENILKDFWDKFKSDDFYVPDILYNDIPLEYKFKIKYNELNSSLFNALKYYQNFIEEAKSKFNINSSSEKFGVFQIRMGIPNNTLVLFNELTIPLCKCDYHLPTKSRDFQNLLIIRNKLREKIGNGDSSRLRNILSILLHKCNYIIQRVKSSSFESNINFETEIINPSSLELGEYSYFAKREIQDKDFYLKDINSDGKSISSFVYLMRYYQDNLVKPDDIKLMEDLINRYIEKYDSFNNRLFTAGEAFKYKYDAFSWNSVLNFLYNCRFSFYVKKCNPQIKRLKRDINKILEIQGSTSIKNFHPFEKGIEAIILCVKEHLANNKFNDWLIEDKLDELGHLIEEYEKALEWSELHKFFPFQLPFEESRYYSEDNTLYLFVPSAFADNIDYKQQRDKLISFKKERDNLFFLFDLSKERRDIENLKETIKTTDKKAFDLIAIFTAAITFLFGTVNIFVVNDKADLAQLICNTIGLGIILILFTSLYLLVSPVFIQRVDIKDYVRSRRLWFGILGFIPYILLIFYLFNYSKSAEGEIMKDKAFKRMDLRIDSLKQEQKSMSLIIESQNKFDNNSVKKNNNIKK